MKNILITSLYFFFSVSVLSQTLITSSPEAAGLSSERLKRIDNLLQSYVDQGVINGTVAMIVKNGKVAYYKAFGYDDIKSKTPLRKDAIFRIASQTKAITSVAVMMLYEEGKFLLDDPLSLYIPEFRNQLVLDKFNEKDTTYTTIPARKSVTIRELLNHTSGIGYAQIGSPQAKAIYYKEGITSGIGIDRYTLGEEMKKLARLPLFHQPGEKWTYGLNTDLLGYLVEVVSGLTLDAFLRKRIFEPLGMKDTHFYLPTEKFNRLTMLYMEDSVTKKAVPMQETYLLNGNLIRDYPKLKGSYYSGGAGLSSTVYDYALFLQMLLNEGTLNGHRILSRHSVRMMTMNQIGDLNMGNNKFGLGFGITTERGSAMLPTPQGVFEWGGMFATTYWVDPKEKLIGLVYRQIFPTSLRSLPDKFKVLVYAALN